MCLIIALPKYFMSVRSGSIHKIFLILLALVVVIGGVLMATGGGIENEDAMENDAMMEEDAMENDSVDAMKKSVPAVPTTSPTASCGEKNAVCDTSDDCCGAMGLECTEVRTSDGGFGKRCLPVEVMICKTDCTNGTWGNARACRKGVAPKGMTRCDAMTGEACKASVHEDRNTQECVKT